MKFLTKRKISSGFDSTLSCDLFLALMYKIFLAELEEVVSVFKSEPGLYTLQTTRSWEFAGLNEGKEGGRGRHGFKMGEDFLSRAKYGQDVIVGLLDSGKNWRL